MSLSAILRLLGSGEIGSVVNVLQAVVHAVMEEIEHLRGEHDQSNSSCLAAMNAAEERTRDLVGAGVMGLAKRVEVLEGMLLEVSRRVDGGGVLAGYEAERKE